MTELLTHLVGKYARKGLLVDTNILLLHFVGSYQLELIPRFKRTAQFTPDDYHLLQRILCRFQPWVTTPNILTEVNSLSGQLGEPVRSEYFTRFSRGLSVLGEEFISSATLAADAMFPRFGLTDTAIATVSKGRYLVLTDDFRLSQFLAGRGVDVINFNHLRG